MLIVVEYIRSDAERGKKREKTETQGSMDAQTREPPAGRPLCSGAATTCANESMSLSLPAPLPITDGGDSDLPCR